jgi:DNA polymerase-4
LRFDDFKTVTRDFTLADTTADAKEIRRAAGYSLKRIDLGKSIRLLGVKAGNLQRPNIENIDEPAQFLLEL